MARIDFGRVSPLPPLALLSSALPRLSRHQLEAVVELLIDRLDEIDGDPDHEDSDEDCAVDDYGCDEADQGDLEDDCTRTLPRPLYGPDQRCVLAATRFGNSVMFRHD